MAAANTDRFKKLTNNFSTTLSGAIVGAGDTSMSLASTTNLPTDTGTVFVIDRVNSSGTATPSTREYVKGTVVGSNVTNLVRGLGGSTAQAHSTGAVVEQVVDQNTLNDLMDGILQDHNQTGYHKDLTDVNGATWLKQSATASAVNYVKNANAATVSPPKLTADGTDTNIDLQMAGKGTGKAHVDGFTEIGKNFVISGGIWTADAPASTRNASMTAVAAYINGQRLSSTTNSPGLAAVTARAFTASKDTYVDILNTSGVGTLVYTEVANNAASPALAANSIRIATVVTGATNIAASTSIGQGGFANTVPVISSQVLSGFDSLGNLIYPKGPSSPPLTQTTYRFHVYRNAALNTANGATAVVAFDTKNFDTGNNVDVTTNQGRFTAPIAGFYFFKARVSTTTAPRLLLLIYKNGAEILRGQDISGNAQTGVEVSGFLQLAANDYVEIALFASVTAAFEVATIGKSYFQGYLVSAS